MVKHSAGNRVRRWTAVAAALFAPLLAGCGSGSDEGLEARRPPAVEALPARSGSLPLEEMLSGIARARDQVAVRSEITGTVREVLVRNGESVRAGQALVRLDASTLEDQLRRAEAAMRAAESTAHEARARVDEVEARTVRQRSLAADGFTSALELETLEAQLAAARAGADQAAAEVEEARAAVAERRSVLAKATIVAPVSGVVGRRNVEVGTVVGSSTMLFVVGNPEQLIVEFPLTQEMVSRIDVGAPVQITTRDREEAPITASIDRISPFLEAGSFSTTAEVDLTGTDGRIRPGMFVSVTVVYGAGDEATLVPGSALWEDPLSGDRTVFIVAEADGLAEPDAPTDDIPETPRSIESRSVTILAEGRGRVAVSGVNPGEWVVTLGQHLLHEHLSAGGETELTARVRPTSWERVVGLERLQREDLLAGFMAKQRKVARVLGAELPDNPAQVDAMLEAAAAANGGTD